MNGGPAAEALQVPVLELCGIQRRFSIGRETIDVLRGVSLRLDRGDFAALTGPSGAGKSILLRIAGLLDDADGGSLFLEGRDMAGVDDDGRTRLRNEHIGIVFQNTPMLDRLTVVENVALPLRYRGIPTAAALDRARAALARMGLDGFASHRSDQLSGGQVQAAGIARALVGRPSLLLADEPTGSLDREMVSRVLAVFEEENRSGSTILLVTHDEEVAARCGRRFVLREGQLGELTAIGYSTVATG